MYIEPFLQYLRYEKNYSSHTVSSYHKDLSQFDLFVQDKFYVSDWKEVQADMIRSWIVSLMNDGDAPRTVNRKLSALKSFFKFLKKEGEVKTNPVKNIRGPKTNKPLPSFVKEKEMDMLLDDVFIVNDFESCRDHLIIELFYLTGMRRAELIELKTTDVDLSANQLKVTGKRNKQRYIPFGDELNRHICEYEKLKDQEVPGSDNYFFVRKNGKKMYPKLVYLLVNKYLTSVSSLSKRSPHVLRHTFATSMLNHGAGLNEVKELLGHESLAATEIYTHITFEELKKVYHSAHPREKATGGH
ncbi:MAG: tyrosine-type recombinase/integrase [Candidatus Azobacteroides sp.]|nr:tyrosine-type recombinase/integrase [Candidatus Azobacteroides sp.]